MELLLQYSVKRNRGEKPLQLILLTILWRITGILGKIQVFCYYGATGLPYTLNHTYVRLEMLTADLYAIGNNTWEI